MPRLFKFLIKLLLKIILIVIFAILFLHYTVSESTNPFREKLLQSTDKILNAFGQPSAEQNILKNPSFEDNFNQKQFPDHWKTVNLSINTDQSLDQDVSLHSGQDSQKSTRGQTSQNIYHLWIPNNTYQLSGWAKINRVSTQKRVKLELIAHYLDGSQKSSFVYFDPQQTNWQQASTSLKLTKIAYKFTVIASYQRQPGTTLFDLIELKRLNKLILE